MSYQVVAPLVIAKDQAGKLQYVYEGGVIPWLSDEQAEHFLSSGLVVETDRGVGGSDPAEAAGDDEGGRPASNANKATLIAWLVANAVKEDGSEYTADELDDLTKADLWDLINAVGDEDETGA